MNYKERVIAALQNETPPTWRTRRGVKGLLEETDPAKQYRFERVALALSMLVADEELEIRYRAPTIEEEQEGYGSSGTLAEFRLSANKGYGQRIPEATVVEFDGRTVII